MKLGLFDAFLRETKEIWQRNVAVGLAKRVLFVKVDDFWGYDTCHIDMMQQHTMCMRMLHATCACAWFCAHALWSQATKFNIVETLLLTLLL